MAISLGALKTQAETDLTAADDRLQLTMDGLGTGDKLTSTDLIGAQLEITMNGVVVNFYTGYAKDRGEIFKGVVRNFT